MDLLLLNDRIGGRLKDGGVPFPRFVKPGRRMRGCESNDDSTLASDTYLSSVSTRMLCGDTGISAPRRDPRKVNTSVTATSGETNTFFVLSSKQPGFSRDKVERTKSPEPALPSARALYNKRAAKEAIKCAGRAGFEHLGGGNNVLIDCTPRSARWARCQVAPQTPVVRLTFACLLRAGSKETAAGMLSSG